MKVFGIGGRKGVGKTHLMKKLIKKNKLDEVISLLKTSKGDLKAHTNKERNYFVLGEHKEGEPFTGTDKLSMSIAPVFQEWAKTNKKKKYRVLFEGNRFFTKSMKKWLDEEKINNEFNVLTATQKKIDAQLAKRGEDLSTEKAQRFLKARETAEKNFLEMFPETKKLYSHTMEKHIQDKFK